MVLKRKRSESEFSFSSSSAFSSPQKPDSYAPFGFDMIHADTSPLRPRPSISSWASAVPSHLPSRTMKRVRDGRPSEDMIHQRTLNLLFSAQRHQDTGSLEDASPQLSQPTAPSHQVPKGGAAQKSLHNFWKLPASSCPPLPPNAACSQDDTMLFAPTQCDDCGGSLGDEGMDGDAMMDVDESAIHAQTSCGACGKHVCSHCSISSLGERRHCLNCAGSKSHAAGTRWNNALGMDLC